MTMTMNMNEVITNVTLTKVCSIKVDKESTESKKINLSVIFDGATIGSLFEKALGGTVISWANGVGRKNYDKWTNNQTVEIHFTSPATRPTEAPEDAFTREARAAGVDMNDEAALAAYIIKRMKSAKK
jgi:hypothetical protein